MSFISLDSLAYFLFLGSILSFYWVLKKTSKNILLLLASYIFYASWNWKCLSLLLISTFVDYYCGKRIYDSKSQKDKKAYLVLSLITNIGILGIFKYTNFFVESLMLLFNKVGISLSPMYFDIILPVGISFYTFQTMSYTIDIYRGRLKPTTSIISFALFVGFFTQLIAGPIERARHLLPQIESDRHFTKKRALLGIDLIVWGLLKKVFIADNIGVYVNYIFDLTNPTLLLLITGTLGFGIQIFCDFSGYTDIARGSAKLLGFDLVKNFCSPYKAKNIIDFWRRWHISLSYWIRDYIYIPLGGSRGSTPRYILNVGITWFLCGLWHGASWNFVIWGLLHALFIIFYKFLISPFPVFHHIPKWVSLTLTFLAVHFAWFVFRVPDFQRFNATVSGVNNFYSMDDFRVFIILICLFLFYCFPFILQALWAKTRTWLKVHPHHVFEIRLLNHALSLCLIFIFHQTGLNEFIYFQF